MTKAKKTTTTLRQRLRSDAESKLMVVKKLARDAVEEVAREACVSYVDLIKGISTGSHTTADRALVTQLANKAEADIESLYNKQMGLLDDDK